MTTLNGLSSQQVEELLQKYGPNVLKEEKRHPLLIFLKKFWAPIPWMLEVIILLQIALGKFTEAWIIAFLLIFNGILSSLQEGKAKNALLLLKAKLEVKARVLRDGAWQLIPAENVVPYDLIRIRMGDIIPADAKLIEGQVSIDQSAITGESLPFEPKIGDAIYAGSQVNHGEAYAQVVSTGKNTFFGKAAEIMSSAKTPSHLQRTIFSIVKYLLAFDLILVILVSIYAFSQGVVLKEIVPFSLLLLVASVPVALPATYALATALGALELSKVGVLVTRLSAIEEAASMDILCVDKTGTITQNVLNVSQLLSFSPYTDEDLLNLAALCCEEASLDPLDLAILNAAKRKTRSYNQTIREKFIPFDPKNKSSGAIIRIDGKEARVLKGSPMVLLDLVDEKRELSKELDRLSLDGSRIICVILGTDNHFKLVGLIALNDALRPTSQASLQQIRDLKVRVIMITGDTAETAKSIAEQVGLGNKIVTRKEALQLSNEEISKIDIFAEVLPEDKFHIVQLLQNQGFICGMTGDGVNDAAALKKAEVGVAVSSATDVAKAASSLVLTTPGLTDVVAAIKMSRQIYQRMLTYTLNKIIKTLQISLLLGVGLAVTKQFILSQLLIVLLLFANDFMTMSIATDRVSYSQTPNKWDIKKLMMIGGVFALLLLGFSFAMHFVGISLLHLSIGELRTWIFLLLVFTGQATVYLARERLHFWHSKPSRWMVMSTILDISIISLMALKGWLMAPILPHLLFALFISVVLFFFLIDLVKPRLLRFFQI